MKLGPDGESFRRQLAYWAIRGVICAAPSFWFAVQVGYKSRSQIVAMAAAVVTFVVGLTWTTSLPGYRDKIGETPFGRWLRLATTLRTSWALLGIAAFAAEAAISRSLTVLTTIFIYPDFCIGMLSVVTVESLTKNIHRAANGSATSFGGTYFTTLLHGTLMALTLAIMAGGLMVLSRLARAWPRRIGVADAK